MATNSETNGTNSESLDTNCLSINDFNDVYMSCESVKAKWETLATNLKVYRPKVEEIESSERDLAKCLRKALSAWLKRSSLTQPKPSWRSLCDALAGMGEVAVSEEIQKEHPCVCGLCKVTTKASVSLLQPEQTINTEIHPKCSRATPVAKAVQSNEVETAATELKKLFRELIDFMHNEIRHIDMDRLRCQIIAYFKYEEDDMDNAQLLSNIEHYETPNKVLTYYFSSNFIGYINYSLVKVFQGLAESPLLDKRIEEYEKDYHYFLGVTLMEFHDTFQQFPDLHPDYPAGIPKFKIHLESEWEGKKVFELKEFLKQCFNNSDCIDQLMIAKISRNCIIIMFAVLPHITRTVLQYLTNDNVISTLKKEGITVDISKQLMTYQQMYSSEQSGEVSRGNLQLIKGSKSLIPEKQADEHQQEDESHATAGKIKKFKNKMDELLTKLHRHEADLLTVLQKQKKENEKEQYYPSQSKKLEQQLLEAKSLTPEKQTDERQDESQDRHTTGEIEKLRKENEELLAKIRRHENLTAIIQQRKEENETLQKIIDERNKEIETLQKTMKELEGRVISPTSEADKHDKDDLKEPKQEDAKLIEDEGKMKEMSENQLQYEQNIESLKREFEEKLEKEKERGRSGLESLQEQLEEKEKTLETEKEVKIKVLRVNKKQNDEIKNYVKTIQQKKEELHAKNEECQKLDADVTAITKQKDEIQQLKDDVEKKMSEQNDDLRVECQELQTSSIKLKGEYDMLQGEYDTLQGEFNKRPPALAFYHPSHTHYVPVTMVMTNFNDYKKNKFQWFSPGFYTRPEGYKLCVKVDAHGRNSGRGTHVSAYVHVMQGEYDDRLTWPFTAKIQLELLNRQADENHKMFTAEFSNSSDIVSRSRIMGAGIITDSGSLAMDGEGEDRLISHGDLGYNSSTFTEFLKDDSIYIRVKSVDIQMATAIPPSPVPLHTTYLTNKFILKEFSKLKAKKKEWQSDPFYTHEKGYKFVLVVHPNGEYTYKGRYIAMFLHITRGEYDDQLVFPFRGNIYVHLVNQIDDQNHSEFIVKYDEESDPRGKHGGRVPRFNFGAERTFEGWGTASLIRHDLLPYNKYRGTKYLTDNDEIEFRIHKIEVFSG